MLDHQTKSVWCSLIYDKPSAVTRGISELGSRKKGSSRKVKVSYRVRKYVILYFYENGISDRFRLVPINSNR